MTGKKSHNTMIFTLIELLVVIAIIGILASMLLQALSKAKAISKSTLCTSQLRSLQLFMFMYAQDYNDTLPLATTDGAGVNLSYDKAMPDIVRF